MLDEHSVIPLYYQLKENLKEKIKEGLLKEDDKVPSERELMQIYKVSRATARKALSELVNEGLIITKQGIGTFVAKAKVLQDPTGDIRFAAQLRDQGLQPSLRIIKSGIEPAPPSRIKNILNTESEIVQLSGVLCADNVPLILETDYIAFEKVPDFFEIHLEKTRFFEYLMKEHNISFTHSSLEIEPILINEYEAKHLQTDSGKPALLIERTMFSDETAVVFQKRVILGERCKYRFTLGQTNPEYPRIEIKP